MKVLTGCQGWNYEDWITRPGSDYVFYPEGTRQADLLGKYCQIFGTVEVDSTFYAIPAEKTFRNWYERSSPEFVFSLKMPSEITHTSELGPASFDPLQLFCSRARILAEKAGVILIQLPPSFRASRANANRLRTFVKNLPDDLSFAVEFRDSGWFVEWTAKQLADNRVSICAVEGEWVPRDLQFDLMKSCPELPLYVRFMGPRNLVRFDRICRPQKDLIGLWHRKAVEAGRDSLFYFSNLFEGFAPSSARALSSLAGSPLPDPETLRTQGSLF